MSTQEKIDESARLKTSDLENELEQLLEYEACLLRTLQNTEEKEKFLEGIVWVLKRRQLLYELLLKKISRET